MFLCISENFVIMWKKVDNGVDANNMVVLGNQVLQDKNRISVEINRDGPEKGSTLVIALAEDKDAGHYVCQLGSSDPKELKHTVQVRGDYLVFTCLWLSRFQTKKLFIFLEYFQMLTARRSTL